MEASCPSASGWHRGGLQGGPLEALRRLASSEPTLLSPDPRLCHLMFRLTSSGLHSTLPPLLPLCLLSPLGGRLCSAEKCLKGVCVGGGGVRACVHPLAPPYLRSRSVSLNP